MKKTKLQRAEPLLVELADGTEFLVYPCSREQMRTALELDPAPGEVRSPADAAAARALQLAALVGTSVGVRGSHLSSAVLIPPSSVGAWVRVESGPILGRLSLQEEGELLVAVMSMGVGQDPAHGVALQRVLKKKAILARRSSAASTTTVSNSPSTAEG
jgi:hypothetical protein